MNSKIFIKKNKNYFCAKRKYLKKKKNYKRQSFINTTTFFIFKFSINDLKKVFIKILKKKIKRPNFQEMFFKNIFFRKYSIKSLLLEKNLQKLYLRKMFVHKENI